MSVSPRHTMRTEPITPEETEAVIALWNRQQAALAYSPKVSDIAEALDVTPEQAQELLDEVRREKKRHGNRGNVYRPGVNPWVSGTCVSILGLGAFVLTAVCVEEVISFTITWLMQLIMLLSCTTLWAVFIKGVQSVYLDITDRIKTRSKTTLR